MFNGEADDGLTIGDGCCDTAGPTIWADFNGLGGCWEQQRLVWTVAFVGSPHLQVGCVADLDCDHHGSSFEQNMASAAGGFDAGGGLGGLR